MISDNIFKITPRFKILPIQGLVNRNTDKAFVISRSDEFKRYKKMVWEITESVKHLIPGVEMRGFKTFHIDHRISIWEGFVRELPIEQIGGLDNLRMLSAVENLKKGRKFQLPHQPKKIWRD